jgi:caffeoyl-CoA O-methyltransferase
MPIYDDALESYVRQEFSAEDQILRTIREAIPRRGLPAITVRPEEGRFLQFLAAASQAGRALEIGTLGGYSGTWIARGLADGGKLITLELEPAHAEVAQEHFDMAGVADRVEIRIGNAHELLPDLSQRGPFDFVFIDAEKEGYPDYLDWTLANLRPGGILAAHNAFRSGRVADPHNHEDSVDVMRAFNQQMGADPRLISSVFPAGDGTAFAIFRGS